MSKSMLKNNKSNQNSNIPEHEPSSSPSSIFILPIIIIVAILPLIMRVHVYNPQLSNYTFFANEDEYVDFFLYYKHQIFIALSAIIAFLSIYILIKYKKTINQTRIFIPLAVYALFSLLSSLLSEYKYFSFHGMFEQFESIYAILGYCITAYYVYLIIKTEKDVKLIIGSLLIGSLLISFIGITQMTGNNFFKTPIGWRMITSRDYWNAIDSFTFTFSNYVFSTLYNPNYVGTYVSLILPILIVAAFISKKLWLKLLFLISSILVVTNLIGSRSSTGMISVLFGLILAFILFRKYIFKYLSVSVPIILLVIVGLFIFNAKYGNFIVNQFNKIANIQKSTPALTEIQTTNNNIVIKYNNNIMQVDFYITEDNICMFNVYDNDFMPINKHMESLNGPTVIQDPRFPGFVLAPVQNVDGALAFSVTIDNKVWYFTNQVNDNSYYIINEYGKYDKTLTAPSILFSGYENYASGRGYIWSRTIPLLKNRILLGTGADTFTFVFPHQDYVNRYNYGFSTNLMTKPHNLYLQIGVQTGVVSLMAFITFYLMYFISSILLYRSGKFSSYYSYIGVAILIGTSSYMVCGFANDSSITVAPLFWVLMGLGIAINKIVYNERRILNN